jgi:hypothetical protein
MGGQLVLVDLTKDRGLVVNRLGLPPEKTSWQTRNVTSKG